MKKTIKHVLSMIIVFTMLTALIPCGIFAEGLDTQDSVPHYEITDAPSITDNDDDFIYNDITPHENVTPASEEMEEVERMRNIILGLVALFSMTVAENAAVVLHGEEFVTPETMEALVAAFDALEFVEYTDITDVETWDLSAMQTTDIQTLHDAINDLNTAINNFHNARRLGIGGLISPDALTRTRDGLVLHLRGENLAENHDLENDPVTGLAAAGDVGTNVRVNFYGGVTITVPDGEPWEHWRGLVVVPSAENFEILADDTLRIRIRNTGEASNTIRVEAGSDSAQGMLMGSVTVPTGETREITIEITQAHLDAARDDNSEHAHNNFRIRGGVINTTFEVVDVMIERGSDIRTSYTVNFDLNGGTQIGTIPPLTQPVYAGEAATAPTVERADHTLSGWTSSPTGMSIDNITGNVTFTAQWTPTPRYTINFDLNGGTLISGELTQQVEAWGRTTPPTFARDGYTFTGWVSSPEGVMYWQEGEDLHFRWISADFTLTAQWVEGYTVNFHLSGGAKHIDGNKK